MVRKMIVLALVILGSSVFASDKPAVQARERMEAEARAHGAATIIVEEHPVANVGFVRESANQYAGTKPAVQARARTEARYAVEENIATEEHPVANVGYRRIVPAPATPAQPTTGTGTKPAVQARLNMEKQQ
jgi:hypothetical protein